MKALRVDQPAQHEPLRPLDVAGRWWTMVPMTRSRFFVRLALLSVAGLFAVLALAGCGSAHTAHPVLLGEPKLIPLSTYSGSGLVVAPDGSRLYVDTNDGIKVIDPGTGTVLGVIAVNGYSLTLSPDGKRLYAVGSDRILPVDLSGDRIESPIDLPHYAWRTAITRDGKRLLWTYSENDVGFVSVVDLTNRTVSTPVALPGL